MRADEAIVLVGGLGTRLRSVVGDVPKPLAPVGGRPFLVWLLDRLADAGLRSVILATGYRGDLVRRAIGREWRGLHIDYSHEEAPRGTGGAIRLAAPRIGGAGAHVFNGDTFLDYNIDAMQQLVDGSGARIGMALAAVPDVARYGAVEHGDGYATAFSEKGTHGPGHINAGCYYLPAATLHGLPATESFSFEQDVLLPAVLRRHVAVLAETSRFIDIGVPDDYARAQQLFGGGS